MHMNVNYFQMRAVTAVLWRPQFDQANRTLQWHFGLPLLPWVNFHLSIDT